MSAVRALYALLAVVAGAAAVLSFAALRDLALVCGFGERLAWLLPVAIDVGAAAGALAWLRPDAGEGRAFGRALALVLLATSVAGNALGHGLAAYGASPHWSVVVAVSAVAPAVLGAVVHLVVLVARDGSEREGTADEVWSGDEWTYLSTLPGEEPSPELPPAAGEALEAASSVVEGYDGPGTETEEGWRAYAFYLISKGTGRKALAGELDISEWEARQLIAEYRQAAQEAPA